MPQTTSKPKRMKVAVVGSGAAGLAATWLLNEYSNHEVHLFESDNRPGGHANTVQFTPSNPRLKPCDVDTGFIVFNPTTYPNFLRFAKMHPELSICSTEMTLSVSRDNGRFEWAGKNPFTLFCQPSRLLDGKHWRLIYDVFRFNACARELIIDQDPTQLKKLSIGEYLIREGYSDAFRDNYLIPMTAAIWSTPPDICTMDFPAQTLIRFMSNHHLLQITGKPDWLTFKGGSHVYVDRILDHLPKDRLYLCKAVTSVSTFPGSPKVTLATLDGELREFDHVIMATHSDTALSLMKGGYGLTALEAKLLSSFRWNYNDVILHSDIGLLPQSKIARSCWNYLTKSERPTSEKWKANTNQVALTYCMNTLQHLSEKEHGPVLVTLNAPFEPKEGTVAGKYRYDHPVVDARSISAQAEFYRIQGTRGITYAGAWLGYGFHEDAFAAGLRSVVGYIPGVRPPFTIEDADEILGKDPAPASVAKFFRAFEQSGLRTMLGIWLSIVLVFLRGIFSRVFDLRHLDDYVEKMKT